MCDRAGELVRVRIMIKSIEVRGDEKGDRT